MKKCYTVTLILVHIILVFSCLFKNPIIVNHESIETVASAEPEPEAPPEDDYLTIIAVGDNLYHNVMIVDGEEGDYLAAYTEIKPLVENADIAFINQETLLGGIDFGFTGYPQFNSPQALGRAVAETGFNVVNHANNHVMDKGEKALLATMDLWDTMPHITVIGVHRSEEKRKQPAIVEKNNFTIGFLGYTYGTNGIPVPAGKSYLVSLINRGKMAEEIEALRPLCDFLVVSLHWGEEYKYDYSKSQKDLAEFLAEHKVDLILGHHPHVIQKIEFIPRPDGKEMLCYYSLGNFISAQSEIPRMLGAMAYVKLKKSPEKEGEVSEITILEYGTLPLVTHYGKDFKGFKVYPLYDYTTELAKEHRIGGLTMDYLKKTSSSIFGDKKFSGNPFDPSVPHL